jgi:penicillin amidase
MARLQMDDIDNAARQMLPTVLRELRGRPHDPLAAKALAQLERWNYRLDGDSIAATVWLRFATLYDYAVWHPVWADHHVPAPPRDVFTPRTSDGTYAVDALRGMLINLTVRDPNNALFSPPGVPKRTAGDLIRQVFTQTIGDLQNKRGSDIDKWRFGGKHYVMMASLLQETVLDKGPYHYGGNGRTINTVVSVAPIRDGKRMFGVAAGGASWRFVYDLGTGGGLYSMPGGQSENPASRWYADGIPAWLQGRFSTLREGDQAQATTKGRTWTLTP